MAISDSELEIMRLIWTAPGPVTSVWVQKSLAGRAWKKTTVLTFLARLCEKGVLRMEKQGKINLYFPLISGADYRRQETRAFLDEMHQGSVASFLAALPRGELSPEELKKLKRWLDQDE